MEEKDILIVTKEGKEKLIKELKDLVSIERPKVIEDIKTAREQGDLSENAEFDAAREKQGQIEDRIQQIEAILDSVKVISKSASQAKVVRIGSKVEIQDLRNNSKKEFKVVGSLEANPFEGLISNKSPLAIALLNQEKGEVVTVEAKTRYDVKIISIKND